MNKKYALDANILISCNRSYYPFDIAPSFWNQLKEKGRNKVVLIDKIRDEIYENEDELSNWLETAEKYFIIRASSDENILSNYTRIINFIQSSEQYKASAKAEFASVADSWLCAHALAYGYIIVTQEKYEPNIKKQVKKPNVCEAFNIKYINLLQFMREIGIRFD